MNPYNPEAKCPKCGCTGIKNLYHPRSEGRYYDGFANFGQPINHEFIERECFNCGYKWNEAPLTTDETGEISRKEVKK